MYTYKDILEEKPLAIDDTVMLYGKTYRVKQNSYGYYLGNVEGGPNDWIFNYLNIQDKIKFCEALPSDTGSFPHVNSLEKLRDVLQKLWDYLPFKIGDEVLVRPSIRQSQGEYGIFVNEQMAGMAGTYIKISELVTHFESKKLEEKGMYNLVYARGYYWSPDIIDYSHIRKFSSSKTVATQYDEEDDYGKSSQQGIGVGELMLPMKSKQHFKIQL